MLSEQSRPLLDGGGIVDQLQLGGDLSCEPLQLGGGARLERIAASRP